MAEKGTWREFLASWVSKPHEEQKLLTALGVRPRTVDRWISGETTISRKKLHTLMQTLPHPHRERFQALVQRDPKLRLALAPTDAASEEETQIPGNFYVRVHDACAHTADLRLSTIADLVLLQAHQQVDPDQSGGVLAILPCMPPRAAENRIHSLWLYTEQTSVLWQGKAALFQGREALAGYCVDSGRLSVVQRFKDDQSFLPLHSADSASMAATPILRGGRIAGCLYMASVEPDFFTPARQTLLQRYSQLAALAFDDEHFYPQRQIALGYMPPASMQPSLAAFRQRLSLAARLAAQRGETIVMGKLEAQLREQMESELLQQAHAENKEL